MEDSGFDRGDELTLLSRAELAERIRQRTADLENVMDTMADLLLKLGPAGEIRMANAAVEDVLGYDRSGLVGRPIDYVLADGDRNAELSTMLASGELVELLLREERVVDLESTLLTAGGEELPTSLSASVLRDEGGTIDGIVCVATDISERKRAEERAAFLHSLLRHDLGNKLSVTDGYLELLSGADLDDDQREYLSHARNGVSEALDLIENVRTLSRLSDAEESRPIDLAAVLAASADRHADLADRRGVEIDLAVDRDLPVIGGSLLTELFANLVENALVHSSGSRVRLSAVDSSDDAVAVAVDDDGTGIPPDRRARIFERGETSADSEGTGLGTYLAARIAESYDGRLEVDDSPLGGARFVVTLPCAAP